jgi:hypothetical protein
MSRRFLLPCTNHWSPIGDRIRERTMRIMRTLAVVLAGACGGGGSGVTVAASAPVRQGPHVHAVTLHFSITMDKLEVEEKTYVDGLAMRLEDGEAAMLTEAPLSACAKLAVVAQGDLDFETSTFGDKPALKLVRNAEYPDGAILLVEPYSTTTLEGSYPALVTRGDRLLASGDVGDAGWGSIDATKYGAENAPHVRLDVELPYATLDESGTVAADASPEAKWLRDTRIKAGADTQAVVDSTLEVSPDDANGWSTSSAWFDILGNWADFNVVAVATDEDCATMVLRKPGFAGGYGEAVIQTRMDGDQRKVTAAQTRDVDSVEGDYFIGRIEHPRLGSFPIVDARATSEEGVGLVVYFSDKPIAAEPFEILVTRQRMLRATSASRFGDQYSFSHYDLGGPGVPVEQLAAGHSTTNPHIDEKEVAGLIKLGEGEGPHIAVNVRLPLAGAAR